MLAKTSMLVCVVLGATLSAAHAQSEAAPSSGSPGGAADGTYQLTLPRGRVLLDAFAEINLSDGAVFEPFSLTPDVWYGATNDLTVGLVHSTLGASGFIGNVGDSLCLTGTSGNCTDVYKNVGVDARYQLKRTPGPFVWAIDGGVYAINLDPLAVAFKLGAVSRWQSKKLVLEISPSLFLGVTERDTFVKETLFLPATALYSVAPKIAVALQLGLVLPVEDAGDAYAVPLSIGGHYDVNESLTVNLAFSLPKLLAGTDPSGFDARSLTLGGTYAF
jgi:hypothetical protein